MFQLCHVTKNPTSNLSVYFFLCVCDVNPTILNLKFMFFILTSPNLTSPHSITSKKKTSRKVTPHRKSCNYRRYTGVFAPLSFFRPVYCCLRLDGELIRARVTLIQRGTAETTPPEEHQVVVKLSPPEVGPERQQLSLNCGVNIK